MNTFVKRFTNHPSLKDRLPPMIAGGLLLMIAFTILSDYWYTLFHSSSFYITESLLFSSYWLLYIPSLVLLFKVLPTTKRFIVQLAIIIIAVLLHLVLYPALVWLLSRTFYYHTFDYRQTFNYGMTAYFIKTVLLYTVPLVTFTIPKKERVPRIEPLELPVEKDPRLFISSILLNDRNQSKLIIAVTGISYISANPPYVELNFTGGKYLHTQTLKSLETQLDPRQFVRIHKSHIVNLKQVSSWVSRNNGDYDLVLADGITLRVSRNYAKEFKLRLGQFTHLNPK